MHKSQLGTINLPPITGDEDERGAYLPAAALPAAPPTRAPPHAAMGLRQAGRELQPPILPGTPRPPQGRWWLSGGEAGSSRVCIELGCIREEQAHGFSQGLEARVMGCLWARHPGPAEAALALRLLLPAA